MKKKPDWETLPIEKQFEWEKRVRYLIERGYLPPDVDIEEQASTMYEKSDV